MFQRLAAITLAGALLGPAHSAAQVEDPWAPLCDMPLPGAEGEARIEALEAAIACMETRIEDLRDETAAMRARAESAETLAREAMRLARAMEARLGATRIAAAPAPQASGSAR